MKILGISPYLSCSGSALIIDEKKQIACVVDPGEADPVIRYIENNNNHINLKYILNTHHHYDHVNGNHELKKNIMPEL